jgi:hypothetical protein
MKTKKTPTWQEYVENCITNFPSMFAAKNYVESELMVADYVFLCNGNGLEWASFESLEGPFVLGEYIFNGQRDSNKERQYNFVSLTNYKNHNFPASYFINSIWYEKMIKKERYASYDFCGYFFEKPELLEGESIDDEDLKDKVEFPKRPFKPEVYYYQNDTTEKAYAPKHLSCFDLETMALQCPPEKMEPSWRQAAIKVCLIAKQRYIKQPIDSFCSYLKAKDYLEQWENLSIEEVKEGWNMPLWKGDNAEDCVRFQKARTKQSYINYLNKVLKHLRVKVK